MSLLEFAPTGLFSIRRYRIFRTGEPIGEIECGKMRERATITIGGISYAATREGLMSRAYYLEENGNRIASAEWASAWRGGFKVQSGARTYTLSRASMTGRAFVLTENDLKVGRIGRQGFFRRRSEAELPDDLALEVQAFLIWLVILIWQRQLLSTVVVGATAGGR